MSEKIIVGRPLPDDSRLVSRLTSILGESQPVQILRRNEKQSGTFPKEIVWCRLADGRELSLFCKYSALRFDAFGHRRGISYEAEVYRRVLSRTSAKVPAFFGAVHDAETGEDWLVLGNLDGAVRARREWHHLPRVAAWLGEFQHAHEGAESAPGLQFLIRYDAPYYAGWATRTAAFSAQRHDELPWLPRLCRIFPDLVPEMLASPLTVVHGEFTVNNIMLLNGEPYPTDWESTAIGFGEIDLVCLVDNWPADTIDACTKAYAAARWPQGPPRDLARRLQLAELYMQLRWLGEEPTVFEAPIHNRIERLRSLAAAFGIVSL